MYSAYSRHVIWNKKLSKCLVYHCQIEDIKTYLKSFFLQIRGSGDAGRNIRLDVLKKWMKTINAGLLYDKNPYMIIARV